MAGDSRREVMLALRGRNLHPILVHPVKRQHDRAESVPSKALVPVYRMLADLLDSGVPLLRALTILQEQTSQPVLSDVIVDVRSSVAQGESLAVACGRHSGVFPRIDTSMIHAGEEGGFLEDALERLAGFRERKEEIRNRVLGALAYPGFLLVVGIIVLIGMLTFFIPEFEPMFARLQVDGQLPLATRALLYTSHFLKDQMVWLIPGFLISGIALRHASQNPGVQKYWDRLRLDLPLVGSMNRSLAIARFCRLLGTLLQNGVELLKALGIAREAAGNAIISEAIADASANVSSGKSIAEPLRACGQFPMEVLELISVGEQSNRLEKTLLSIADKWDRRTYRQLDTLTKLIEPALMLVMAGLIGFMVIALLLPVFENPGTLN